MSRLHRLLRKPFFGRFEVPWVWPAGVDVDDWESVQFRNSAGARLAGLWGVARGAVRGTLVLAHPMGKAAKGFWLRYGHAEVFRDAGYHVLAFDANGFGESEAVSFDYPDDIWCAGRWAADRAGSGTVGLIGASFGAGWGLCAMAREGSPFSAAVLEGVFPTLPDFWRHYPVAYAALRLSQVVWPSLERGLRPELEATRLRGQPRVLLLYGDADRFTPPSHGDRLARALARSSDVSMQVFAGVGHTFALRDARTQYLQAVLPFLANADR